MRVTTIVIIIIAVAVVSIAFKVLKQFDYFQSLSDQSSRYKSDEKFPFASFVSIKPIIISLQDDNEQVRENAVYALRALKHPQAIEPLIAVLKDKHETVDVRCAAAYALKDFNDPRAVKTLDEVKNDENEDFKVRDAATPYSELYQ
ncbi:HEAT repeat domain-containing protein [Candidatus Omnitrophota bacterium]